jgi:hypothetical protein
MIPEVEPVGLTMLIIFVAVAVIVIKAIIRSLKSGASHKGMAGAGRRSERACSLPHDPALGEPTARRPAALVAV